MSKFNFSSHINLIVWLIFIDPIIIYFEICPIAHAQDRKDTRYNHMLIHDIDQILIRDLKICEKSSKNIHKSLEEMLKKLLYFLHLWCTAMPVLQ